MPVDEYDRRVLAALLENARASADELGDIAGVTPETASWHRRTLEATGVIETYRPRLDYDALGYDLVGVLRIDVAETEAREAVVAELCAGGPLHSVYEVAGPSDVVAVGRFRDATDLASWCRSLRTDPRIGSVGASTGRALSEFDQFVPE
ncbi:MAG: Lrp/AsnC family transcriptional regulator [Salinirussus sp.]